MKIEYFLSSFHFTLHPMAFNARRQNGEQTSGFWMHISNGIYTGGGCGDLHFELFLSIRTKDFDEWKQKKSVEAWREFPSQTSTAMLCGLFWKLLLILNTWTVNLS